MTTKTTPVRVTLNCYRDLKILKEAWELKSMGLVIEKAIAPHKLEAMAKLFRIKVEENNKNDEQG